MSMKWKQDDWEIHLNAIGDKAGGGWCLRHMGCASPDGTYEEVDGGHCACSKGMCYLCNTEVPDDIKGFFELVKWKR